MSANVREFTWNKQREKAAALLAAGDLSDGEIADQIGITDRQLRRWKQQPAFSARVAEIVDRTRRAIEEKGIALKQNRIAALVDRQQRMQRVIEARATEHRNVPGGDTGLLVRQVKLVKVYESDRDEPAPDGQDAGDESLHPTKRV